MGNGWPESRHVPADRQIRAQALQAAATLLAPSLAEMAAAFRAEDLHHTAGGALKVAARFEDWIRDGAEPPKPAADQA